MDFAPLLWFASKAKQSEGLGVVIKGCEGNLAKFCYFWRLMKYLHALSLILILVALGGNFYMDHQRDKAIMAKLDALAKPAAKAADEPSPFDKVPVDPLLDSHKPPVAGNTSISFEHTAVDLGRKESGPTYSAIFNYKNTGSENLYISAADASCGCTVAKWSKDAIKPGASGEIEVDFDSKGRNGEQLKTVTVTTNTEPNKNVLTLHTFLYLKTQ